MLQDKSKLVPRGTVGGASIYLSSALVHDSQFPFKVGDDVEVVIDAERKAVIICRSIIERNMP